ncbi:unnamed protein product [Bemisia tabaci]|uniref:Uncharacterized protein n=1 Tax=Bemisia tabaci TaxID=7038 RepID=A0A9P0ABH5_BEMTA|nr:unnamed protein product [Bemisia tabaci]
MGRRMQIFGLPSYYPPATYRDAHFPSEHVAATSQPRFAPGFGDSIASEESIKPSSSATNDLMALGWNVLGLEQLTDDYDESEDEGWVVNKKPVIDFPENQLPCPSYLNKNADDVSNTLLNSGLQPSTGAASRLAVRFPIVLLVALLTCRLYGQTNFKKPLASINPKLYVHI